MSNLVEMKARVQQLLIDHVGTIELLSDGRFAFGVGSTRLFVRVNQREGADYVYAILTAPITFDVPTSPELFKWVALNADQYLFGHIGVAIDSEDAPTATIVFTHTLLVDYLDADELRRAVNAVTSTADELDDEVVAKFGGKRYQDS